MKKNQKNNGTTSKKDEIINFLQQQLNLKQEEIINLQQQQLNLKQEEVDLLKRLLTETSRVNDKLERLERKVEQIYRYI